jgi:hypothetical protein
MYAYQVGLHSRGRIENDFKERKKEEFCFYPSPSDKTFALAMRPAKSEAG